MTTDRWTVTITGRTGDYLELMRIAPPSWSITTQGVDSVERCPDAVVVIGATRARVQEACLRYPEADVLAVVDRAVAASDVVAVFDAGATACVRGVTGSEILAHLQAIRRRQLVGRPAVALAG